MHTLAHHMATIYISSTHENYSQYSKRMYVIALLTDQPIVVSETYLQAPEALANPRHVELV